MEPERTESRNNCYETILNAYPLSVNGHESPKQILVSREGNTIGCESSCLCFEKVPGNKKDRYYWNSSRKIMTLNYIQNRV